MEQLPVPNRNCDGCTECCKGYLWGEAYGKKFYNGRPCFYVGEKGCSIYENRPNNPCVQFKCSWLEDTQVFPEWFKPSLSKLLIKKEVTKNGIEYYKVHECGRTIDAVHLNYLISLALEGGINIQIQLDGGVANYGKLEFLRDL